jgi:hypothetical protein
MPRSKTGGDKKHGDPLTPPGERSSPGSGEDEASDGAADLQPGEVEGDETAR